MDGFIYEGELHEEERRVLSQGSDGYTKEKLQD